MVDGSMLAAWDPAAGGSFQPSNQTQTNFQYFAVLVVCNLIGRFGGSEGVHSVALLRCFH